MSPQPPGSSLSREAVEQFETASDTLSTGSDGDSGSIASYEDLSNDGWVSDGWDSNDSNNWSGFLRDQEDLDATEHDSESVSSRAQYSPSALVNSFKDLSIAKQIINKTKSPKVFTEKLSKREASLLYCFAAFFCLNGPVGFKTKVHLRYECRPLGIKVDETLSIRDAFQNRLSHGVFLSYVKAVKKSLPQNIDCPMIQNHGRYF